MGYLDRPTRQTITRLVLFLAVCVLSLLFGPRLMARLHSNVGLVKLLKDQQHSQSLPWEASFERALALDRRLASARYGLGLGLMLNGDAEAAADQFLSPACLGERRKLCLFLAGEAYLRSGDAVQATNIWSTLANGDVGLRIELSEQVMAAGFLDQGIDFLEAAFTSSELSDGERLALRLKLADVHQWRNPPVALEHAQAAVKVDPTSADAYAELAWALLQLGRNVESSAAGQKALRLGVSAQSTHTTWNGTYEVLGRALLADGRCQAAIAPLEQSVRLSPPWVLYPHIALGRAYLCVGRNSEAADRFRRALEISPGNADAKVGLSQALEP